MKTLLATTFQSVLLGGASLLMALLPGQPAAAHEDTLKALADRWEVLSTKVPEPQREAGFERLAGSLDELLEQHPDVADIKVWKGVALASLAREKAGLGGLKPARQARLALERGLEAGPAADMQVAAYVTLGVLYDRVPGGLIGFGDSAQAEAMFQRALALRPEGAEVHFHYAGFLSREGQDALARRSLDQAANAIPRPARLAYDQALIAKAREMLAQPR